MSDVKRQAAAWATKRRDHLTDREQKEFEAWFKKPGNAEAYARAVDDFEFARRMSPDQIEDRARELRRAPVKLRWAAAAIAAVALATGFGWYATSLDEKTQVANIVESRPGEWKLADGTIVRLKNGARIEQQFTSGRRTVLLLGGHARFDVAHDPSRPFAVIAGLSEITALGTIFEVDLTNSQPHIHLVKGSVEVRSKAGGTSLRLRPGESAEVSEDGPRRVPAMKSPVGDGLSSADQAPLGTVLDEANAHGAVPIRLADPSLAMLPVDGRFNRSADSLALARKLAAALDLKVDERDGEIILTQK